MTDRLTMADVRTAGFCVSGTVQFCKDVGLDHRHFIRHGVPITQIEHIDDVSVQRSIAIARERIANG